MGRGADNQGYFLRSGSLSVYAEATLNGVSVLDLSAEMLPRIEDLSGRDAASFFARPYLTRPRDEGPRSVSWYADIEGAALPWVALDPRTREQAAAEVRTRIEALAPALADASIGPFVQRALNVADVEHDLLVVGGRPVLTNWGLLPGAVANDIASRHDHWRQGLGGILGRNDPPPFSTDDPEMAEIAYPSAGPTGEAAVRGGAGVVPPSVPTAVSFAPTQRPARGPVPSWVWPAAASGAVLFAILLLLLLPRIALLPVAFGTTTAGYRNDSALLERRAALLRRELSLPCPEPVAR